MRTGRGREGGGREGGRYPHTHSQARSPPSPRSRHHHHRHTAVCLTAVYYFSHACCCCASPPPPPRSQKDPEIAANKKLRTLRVLSNFGPFVAIVITAFFAYGMKTKWGLTKVDVIGKVRCPVIAILISNTLTNMYILRASWPLLGGLFMIDGDGLSRRRPQRQAALTHDGLTRSSLWRSLCLLCPIHRCLRASS